MIIRQQFAASMKEINAKIGENIKEFLQKAELWRQNEIQAEIEVSGLKDSPPAKKQRIDEKSKDMEKKAENAIADS